MVWRRTNPLSEQLAVIAGHLQGMIAQGAGQG
jgi:hypothetical protein